jgi:hypothetical protein
MLNGGRFGSRRRQNRTGRQLDPTRSVAAAARLEQPEPTVPYPDADVQVRDLRLKKYIAGTTLLRRVSTRALRAPTGFYLALCSMRSRKTFCWFIREIKASGDYAAARRRTGAQQQARGRIGQQARAHRLERAAQ